MPNPVAKTIGVPSVKGMKTAFTDFGVGAIGGLIYMLSQAILGSGTLGALAAPVLAGSVVKGSRGTALATIAGFMLLSGLTGQASAAPATESNTEAVM